MLHQSIYLYIYIIDLYRSQMPKNAETIAAMAVMAVPSPPESRGFLVWATWICWWRAWPRSRDSEGCNGIRPKRMKSLKRMKRMKRQGKKTGKSHCQDFQDTTWFPTALKGSFQKFDAENRYLHVLAYLCSILTDKNCIEVLGRFWSVAVFRIPIILSRWLCAQRCVSDMPCQLFHIWRMPWALKAAGARSDAERCWAMLHRDAASISWSDALCEMPWQLAWIWHEIWHWHALARWSYVILVNFMSFRWVEEIGWYALMMFDDWCLMMFDESHMTSARLRPSTGIPLRRRPRGIWTISTKSWVTASPSSCRTQTDSNRLKPSKTYMIYMIYMIYVIYVIYMIYISNLWYIFFIYVHYVPKTFVLSNRYLSIFKYY